jgi:outer membrane protein assembly factor BamB
MADLDDGWTRHVSEDGRAYYHNTETGETRWESGFGGSTDELAKMSLKDRKLVLTPKYRLRIL